MNRRLFLAVSLLLASLTTTSAQDPGYPPLPKAVSSLGAIVHDGYLYTYGGHAGKTHTYSTQDVLGSFQRLKLDGGKSWEELPGGPILQGMNLAAHGGKIYRVGGMQPQNEPGQPANNSSVTTASRFDPKSKQWETLPELPVGRSSHELLAVGDKLVVIGGWNQKGERGKTEWHTTALTLDLKAKDAKWESHPQPFQRRALTATALGTKVYIIGGLGEKGSDRAVEIWDTATNTWSKGPELPGSERVAFSPAATTVENRVIVNTSAGPVFRLNETGQAWEKVGEAKTKRMVARLVPHGKNQVILVGGASGGGNVGTAEVITLAEKGEPVAGE